MTAPEIVTKDLTLTLFGPMQVRVQDQPLPPLRSRKALSLLALLALRHGRPVGRAWLAETLWPDTDRDRAGASLRVVLSELRHALGTQAEHLQSPHRHTLCVELTGVDIDVTLFDAAITANTPASLEQAIALYQGSLLEGLTEEWVASERGAREQSCLRALETLAEAAQAAEEFPAATGYWRRAVTLAPWWETARRGLMEALARDGETNAALEVYREFLEQLRGDPNAAPDERTSALYARLRKKSRQARVSVKAPGAEPQDDAAPVIAGFLPHPLTELVGREDERREVAGLLGRSRLVTLTGPGGIGKTRLALAVAAKAAPEFPDGVWLICLEALSQPDRVASQIAAVLGVRQEAGRTLLETLAEHLRAKRVLLVLDNCEHLLEACAQTAGFLLQNCAGLKVLATSRTALGITGEAVWAVPSLSVPIPEMLTAEETDPEQLLLQYESIRLFVERAQAVHQSFALMPGNAPAVAQICARLQGVPLAIELAAARIKAMTPTQIVERLDNQLGLLTGGSREALPRRQTLRATLDWSHALLSIQEQLMLARLSVFAAGWTLEAAETVCAGHGVERSKVPDLLTGLVDKSLVAFEMRDEESGGRYRLLEIVRQYAAEKLGEGERAEFVRNRHRDWCMTLVAERYMSGPDAEQRLGRIEREQDNLRAALAWCTRDPKGGEAGLRLGGALWPFWYTRGYSAEARQHLQRILDHPGAQEATPERALVLNAAGTISNQLSNYPTARALLEESLSIRKQSGNQTAISSALNSLGNVYYALGELDEAQKRYEEALRHARDADRAQHIAWSLTCLGDLAQARGESAEAVQIHEEALSIRRAGGDQHSIGFSLMKLAEAVCGLGDCDRAHQYQEEALRLFQELGSKLHIAWVLNGLGDIAYARSDFSEARAFYRDSLTLFQVAADLDGIAEDLDGIASVSLAQGAPTSAARLWGAVATLRESVGMVVTPNDRAKLDARMAQARAALGDNAYGAAWEDGRRLHWKQALVEIMN
jgi:predicted ATPase/DNA-binding SARP family transcriptional activator